MNATLAAKKGGSDLERAADAWAEYAEILAGEATAARDQMGRQMSREYSEYARGCAAGLREALRILAREEVGVREALALLAREEA